MTKEESLQAWIDSREHCPEDAELVAYMDGWDMALKSITPYALPDTIPYKEILDEMNVILGRSFKMSNAFKALVKSRWTEGFRQADFAKVCRIKKQQWEKDPEMNIYLRPLTLFGTKMDAYNNEVDNAKKCTTADWM